MVHFLIYSIPGTKRRTDSHSSIDQVV